MSDGKNDDSFNKEKNIVSTMQKSKNSVIKIIIISVILLIMCIISISLFKRYKSTTYSNISEKRTEHMIFQIFDDIKIKICNDEFSHDFLREKLYNDCLFRYMKNHLSKGDTVIEVDHGIGAQTLLIAKLVGQSGRVYSYNPCMQYVDAIKESSILNNMESRIKIDALAMSSHTFDGLFIYKNNFPIIKGKLNKKTSKVPSGYSAMMLEATSIDERLPNLQNINWLKININGNESDVLKGALKVIEKSEKIRIIFSYNRENFGDLSVIKNLMHLGFNLYSIQKNGDLKPVVFEGLKGIVRRCHLLMSKN